MQKREHWKGAGKGNKVPDKGNEFVCVGCYNKALQTGWLKHQKFLFSQFWRLERQDQAVSTLGSLRGLFPWLANGCLLPMSSWPFL